MTCPFGFLVVLPDQMLLIPVDSHFSWLTMFYMLPKELVEKRPEYLNIPRNIRDIADNEENMKLIQNDSFTEFVWSCYAYTSCSPRVTAFIVPSPAIRCSIPETFRCGVYPILHSRICA